MQNNKTNNRKFRVLHRYIGNFMAGIMAVYAVSGIVLIFRDTDYLKIESQVEKTVGVNLAEKELGKALRLRGLKLEKTEGDILYFKQGTYDQKTGVAKYAVLKLPIVLEKITHLHKAKTGDRLFWFNIFFGIALLLLVISSFWMYRPKTKIFTRGMYLGIAGVVLVLIMIFVN